MKRCLILYGYDKHKYLRIGYFDSRDWYMGVEVQIKIIMNVIL